MLVSCFHEKCSKTLFFVGVFQLLLAYVLVGYIISIYWGWLIVKKALEDQVELQNFLDRANVRSDAPPASVSTGAGIGGVQQQPSGQFGFAGGNSSGYIGARRWTNSQ